MLHSFQGLFSEIFLDITILHIGGAMTPLLATPLKLWQPTAAGAEDSNVVGVSLYREL